MRSSASDEPGRPRRRRSLRAGVAIATALLALACSKPDPARVAAERFVDAYYVEIDLPRAREEAVGLARAKVDGQIELLAGQGIADAASRPSVHYRFLERQGGGDERDRRGYVYELTITLDGGEQIQRRALVTVREEANAWRAANFQELD